MMARISRFQFDTVGIGRYLLSSELNDGLTGIARRAKVLAVSLSPRGSTTYVRRFFIASAVGGVEVAGNLRTAVYLGNDAPQALPLEFGTRRKRRQGGNAGRPQRILGRTAAALTTGKPKVPGG